MTSSNFYRVKIKYNGFGLSGFQSQTKQSVPTVQDQVNKALEKISKSEVKTIGSGRTDAGVHAHNQVLKVAMNLDIDPESLVKAMNSNLPESIRAIKADKTTNDFHPIGSASSKEYWYCFYISQTCNPFLKGLMTHFKPGIDIEKLESCLESFVGEHDFQNYFTTGTEMKSSIREIYSFSLSKDQLPEVLGGEDYFILKIKGSGFLKQMVRLIVGALVEAGRGKVLKSQIEESLEKSLKDKLGATAPADGLFLKEVSYPDGF